MKTKTEIQQIVNSATRCTEAALKVLEVKDISDTTSPRTQYSGCLNAIDAAGKTKRELIGFRGKTLRYFSQRMKPYTLYFIHTSGHTMAVCNGILADTMHKTFDNRKIINVWEISETAAEPKKYLSNRELLERSRTRMQSV